MSIKLIACLDINKGIGYKQELLFNIKEDMQRFKELTTGNSDVPNIVIMGRRTFQSLPKPLPNRVNVVLTRNVEFSHPPEVFVMDSVEKIVNHYRSGVQDRDLFIIGGFEVYNAFLPYADEVHLTMVDKEAENVDTYFPYALLKQHFKAVESEKYYSEEEECNYTFITYRHK